MKIGSDTWELLKTPYRANSKHGSFEELRAALWRELSGQRVDHTLPSKAKEIAISWLRENYPYMPNTEVEVELDPDSPNGISISVTVDPTITRFTYGMKMNVR